MIFIGDVGLDHYVNSELSQYFWGGCSLNAWLAARELSPQAKLLSTRSSLHEYPEALLEVANNWPCSELHPPTQLIKVDDTGERHLGEYQAGALSELSLQNFADFEKTLFNSQELIALPLYEQTKNLCLEILKALPPNEARLCLDVGTMIDFGGDLSFLNDYLDRILLIQASECNVILPEGNQHLYLVSTNGPRPMTLERAGQKFTHTPPAILKPVLDTTGAGDYFFGRLCALLELHGELSAQHLLQATHEIERVLTRVGPNLLE